MAALGLASLSTDVMVRVAVFLEHDQVDSMRRLNGMFREAHTDDELWKSFFAARYFPNETLSSLLPLAPFWTNRMSSSVKEAETWRECAYRWRYVARFVESDEREFCAETWKSVAASWRVLEDAAKKCGIRLLYPAHKSQLSRVRAKSLRYAFAIHDGQEDCGRTPTGVFGNFSAYNVHVSQAFCSVQHLTAYTEDFPETNLFSLNAMRSMDPRVVAVSDEDDEVVMTDFLAAPKGVGFRGYFAEYASRVASGYYRIVEDFYSEISTISLFPDSGPDVAEAVTNGVRVRVSAIYIHTYQVFVYSVRLMLLERGECQLKTRRWTFTRNEPGAQPEQVVGDGVVGKVPRLICSPDRNGQLESSFRDDVMDSSNSRFVDSVVGELHYGEFAYQSFTRKMPRGGTFKGIIDFIPGDVRNPTGDIFQVVVPECRLDANPAYVF